MVKLGRYSKFPTIPTPSLGFRVGSNIQHILLKSYFAFLGPIRFYFANLVIVHKRNSPTKNLSVFANFSACSFCVIQGHVLMVLVQCLCSHILSSNIDFKRSCRNSAQRARHFSCGFMLSVREQLIRRNAHRTARLWCYADDDAVWHKSAYNKMGALGKSGRNGLQLFWCDFSHKLSL